MGGIVVVFNVFARQLAAGILVYRLLPTAAHRSRLLTPTPSSTVDPVVVLLAQPSPTSPMTLPGLPATILPGAQMELAGRTVPSRILTLSLIMTMFPMTQLAPI